MVNVTNCPHVAVRLGAVKFLFRHKIRVAPLTLRTPGNPHPDAPLVLPVARTQAKPPQNTPVSTRSLLENPARHQASKSINLTRFPRPLAPRNQVLPRSLPSKLLDHLERTKSEQISRLGPFQCLTINS